jgi:4-amino-4-deoxy-L-arabinose transferase-like glycosyltransferase
MTQFNELSNSKNNQSDRLHAGRMLWLGLLLVLAAVVFALRNLPWHLDNYDQAKQAFAALDVVRNGNWLLQSLPMGGFATKPPLMAWLQAGAYWLVGGNWEVAWRLPSYVAALVLLGVLARTGWRMGAMTGAVVAVSAFAFNMLSIRIATLVRTDMLLALLCFLPGLMVYQHVNGETQWTKRGHWLMFLLILAGVFAKGHSVYAFVLPGLLFYAVVMWKRGQTNVSWPGWLALWMPLAVFVMAVVWAVARNPAFYDQIVVGEIYSVFGAGGGEGGRSQHLFYYVVHLLQKWAPWSLVLMLYAFLDRRRLRQYWRDPGFVWLICWVAGGLLVMSLVPQKRVDRIYPVIAPLCMLLTYLIVSSDRIIVMRMPVKRFVGGLVVLGVLGWTLYTGVEVWNDYRRGANALKQFSRELAQRYDARHIEVVAPCAEGFVCDLEKARPLSEKEALLRWHDQPAVLIASQFFIDRHNEQLAPFEIVLLVDDPFYDTRYACIQKVARSEP